MVLNTTAGATQPPFYYARVLGIFHVKVKHPRLREKYERMNILHVRWFRQDTSYKSGWEARRHDRIQFISSTDPHAFGLLDPALVVRGAHLIPAFAHGHTHNLLRSFGPSIARVSPDGDWKYYYVARFADCDMTMRYTNLGVGHEGARPPFIDMQLPEPFPEITQSTTNQGDDWGDEDGIVDEDVLDAIPEEPED